MKKDLIMKRNNAINIREKTLGETMTSTEAESYLRMMARHDPQFEALVGLEYQSEFSNMKLKHSKK